MNHQSLVVPQKCATVLAEREAGLLGVPAFAAALHVERTAYDARGRAVEQAVSTYRSDRYSYHLTVRRPSRTPTLRRRLAGRWPRCHAGWGRGR